MEFTIGACLAFIVLACIWCYIQESPDTDDLTDPTDEELLGGEP